MNSIQIRDTLKKNFSFLNFFKLKNIVKEIDIDVIRLEKFLTKKNQQNRFN